jgi:Arc/MetJ-type ribon-helix-helix transcriptional regulator
MKKIGFKGIYVELGLEDYKKLKELITSGKYVTIADAIRTFIRRENTREKNG